MLREVDEMLHLQVSQNHPFCQYKDKREDFCRLYPSNENKYRLLGLYLLPVGCTEIYFCMRLTHHQANPNDLSNEVHLQ